VVPVLLLVLALLPAASAEARPQRGGERLARNWQELNPTERQRALENLQRYKSLPESSRKRMDRSYENWQKLPPNERERVQRNYQKYRQMSPGQRREFENKYKRWKGGTER
jgi:hypothetical protein